MWGSGEPALDVVAVTQLNVLAKTHGHVKKRDRDCAEIILPQTNQKTFPPPEEISDLRGVSRFMASAKPVFHVASVLLGF